MNMQQIEQIQDRNERHRRMAIWHLQYDIRQLAWLRHESKYYEKKFKGLVSHLVAVVQNKVGSY